MPDLYSDADTTMVRRPTFLFLIALVACTRSVADSGQTCELNSDCRAPLVCAAALCRPQCRVDLDCAPSETCHAYAGDGVCVPPAMPVPCAYPSECGAGLVCLMGACRAQCMTDVDCGSGACISGTCSTPVVTGTADGGDASAGDGGGTCAGTLCGSACVDLASNPEHCGACGIGCAGHVCSGGTCAPECVDPRETPCATGCTNIAYDGRNCGGCGQVCASGGCLLARCIGLGDDCSAPAVLDLSTTTGALEWSDTDSDGDSINTCSRTADVFYDVRVSGPELVVVIAESGPELRMLDVQCPTLPVSCRPSSGGVWVGTLAAGDHYFGHELDMGVLPRVTVLHVPLGAARAFAVPDGATTVTGDLTGGGAAPGSCSAGSTDVHYWVDDSPSPPSHVVASTCGSPTATTIGLVGGEGGPIACAPPGSCAPGTTLDTLAPPGVGSVALRALFVSGATAGDVGPYTLTLTSR